ncbi:hypothetical protein ABB37_00088 [Leptomonas pyrrhocoris]|uniref:Uncharacterized protein n=1 Tax=Leptomonas pyrrhocoris TaxID=157538 RepID=A0A0M9G9X6_LEPPY|nr:hypothetical protein ABB37_00088 [Leptomonas pyrrhocoris]KPA85719.1 hypothetical protein ABB37_00088 [Leptomonas pyrrhocoris]|eukprot:XP_015664158.1 hypothetical protein ABB37_00088 [Leptomonas pyrrhocoris]
MSVHVDFPQRDDDPHRTRCIADDASVTAAPPTPALPSFALAEEGRSKGEFCSSAIQVLLAFLHQQAGTIVEPVVSSGKSLTATTPSAALTYHHAIAALIDVQSMLDSFTLKAATTSAAVKATLTSAMITVLLGDGRSNSLLEVLSAFPAEVGGMTTLTPSFCAAELMARTVDALAWVVDAVCAPLVEDLTKSGFHTTPKCVAVEERGLWNELVAHEEVLLHFARVALAPASCEAHRWGAAVCSYVVRTVDALLQTCFVIRSYANRRPNEKVEENETEEDDSHQQVLLTASRLGQQLTADDTLRRVTKLLQMPVQVLDEMDVFTRKSHTVCYDVLRHGALSAANDEDSVINTARKEMMSASASKLPWAPLDSTRRPQSPLELYTCIVSYLSHAAAYRNTCLPEADRKENAVCSAVCKAYVCVLERALQAGETALTAPSVQTPTAASPSPTTAQEGHVSAPVEYLSPRIPRVGCYSATRRFLSPLPSLEVDVADSEPGSLCESPVMNTQAGVLDKDDCRPLRLTPAANDADELNTLGTVTHSRRSSKSPACPARVAGAETPSSDESANPATVAIPAPVAAASTTESNTAASSPARDSFGVNVPCLDRGAGGAQDGMLSNAMTLAGMTDAETASFGGESAGRASLARARPMAITSAAAPAAAIMTAAMQSNAGGKSPSTLRSRVQRALVKPTPSPSPSSYGGSLPLSSVAPRQGGGSDAAPIRSVSSSRPHLLCKSAISPTNSCEPFRPSVAMEPFSLTAHGPGSLLHYGLSKSSCLQRERQTRMLTEAAAAAAFMCPTPVLRSAYPSHVLLTNEVLTSLAHLTKPNTCTEESMAALVDANVLTVLSQLLEYPGNTVQEVVTPTLEHCFAFWESMVSQSPAKLFHLSAQAPDTNFDAKKQREGTTLSSNEGESEEAASALPTPLRALLKIFSDFLGWDGEAWALLHAQYMERALRLLIDVLTYIKDATSVTRKTARQCLAHLTLKSNKSSASRLLAQVVDYLLRRGAVAHIWCCLSTDATQIPGAMRMSSPSSSPTTAAAAANGRAPTPVPEEISIDGNGFCVYSTTARRPHALLSAAQCTAVHLLYTLAKSLDWSSAKISGARSTAPLDAPVRNSDRGSDGIVPDAATYRYFMEESFKHLPACANCLRRCTYTRTQSHPIVPADHEALSRVLHVLRILFAAMGAGVQGPGGGRDAVPAMERRQRWAQQIADSQVLEILAHIGTAAELVRCELPRLCLFTLRSYFDHVHVLADNPLTRPVRGSGSTPPRLSSALPGVEAKAAAATGTAAAHLARAQAGMAALQALVVDPPPLPVTAGTATWGREALRESLLVVLLARMQRRCAGQSANASVPQQMEVYALLTDVLGMLVDSLPTTPAATSWPEGGTAIFDAAAAAELIRLTQHVVSAVIGCHLWSGSAQELRYLNPRDTPPVKEALRFLCRVAQVVNGSVQVLSCAAPSDQGSASSTAEITGTLGRHMASVLLAESMSVTFAFHVVTMDLPLALAGLINGKRWQMCGKQSSPPPPPQRSGALSGGISNGSNRTDNGHATSSSSAPSSTQMTLHATASVAVTMTPPSPSPPILPTPQHAANEFDDDDRRETCEVAASALVELLSSVRRAEALLGCAAVLSPAMLGTLSRRSSGTCGGGSVRTGGSGAAAETAESAREMSATTAFISPSSSQSCWAQGEAPHQLDVIVVQNAAADFAGVVTSRVYPLAIAALAGSLPSPDDDSHDTDTRSPGEQSASDSTGLQSLTTTLSNAEPESDDPRNWRQTELQWRRRVPLLRTAIKDALHVLDLDVLDHYLDLRRRHQAYFYRTKTGTYTSRDDESTSAEEGMVVLATEKKRYLESL